MPLQRRHFLILLYLSFGSYLQGQSFQLRRADEAMKRLDYVTAISQYLQVLEHHDVESAKINLAECYRKINDWESAAYWYDKVVQSPDCKPVHKLYYAMALQAMGKCSEAVKWAEAYSEVSPDDLRAKYLLRSCAVRDELMHKNKGIYTVKPMPFNSGLDDYGTAILGSKLIFSSDRARAGMVKRTSLWTGNPFSDLYMVDFTEKGNYPGDFLFGDVKPLSDVINTKYNDAAPAFSADGKTVYFTRNNFLDGRAERSESDQVKLGVFEATLDSNMRFSNVQRLSFNSEEYHSCHPGINADGSRLYFASNRPGGYGGMDLYVCQRQGDKWSSPINLGPQVNTEGNEIFPFPAKDGRLYFASNGHIGLGGLDMYYTTEAQFPDKWNLPVNLGAPLNSVHDDFALVINEDQSWGFFSSDRDVDGGGRDNIFGFHKNAAPVEIKVIDAQSGLPLAGVSVQNGANGLAMQTGTDGIIAFDMRYAECADFRAEKKGYAAAQVSACADSSANGILTRAQIPMTKIAEFTVQGLVFDMRDGLPAESAGVYLFNTCGKALPSAIQTGADGRFKFKLEKSCCYVVKAVSDGFIAGVSDTICTEGLLQSKDFRIYLNLQPYGNPYGISLQEKSDAKAPEPPDLRFNSASGLYEQANGLPADADLGNGLTIKSGILYDGDLPGKPQEGAWARSKDGFLVNLYYDFNAVEVGAESIGEMYRLLRTLLQNPALHIEISSHTDARGSDTYNMALSQQRADALVNWLCAKGVARERLIAVGYGESKPVNHCTNDIPCSETEHAANRRTEFSVIDQGNAIQSKPKEGVKVAPCVGCPF